MAFIHVQVAAYFCVSAIVSTGSGSVGVAIFISLVTECLPTFVKYVTIYVEKHQYQSNLQESIFVKLFIVRCIIFAVFAVYTPKSQDTRCRCVCPPGALCQLWITNLPRCAVGPTLRAESYPGWVRMLIVLCCQSHIKVGSGC